MTTSIIYSSGKQQLVLTPDNELEKQFLEGLFKGDVDVTKQERTQIVDKNAANSVIIANKVA